MSSIDQEVPQNTRLLKIIVIVLGILLVVGFIVVIATIIIRLGSLSNETEATQKAAPALTTAAGATGAYELPLSSGEQIKNFTLDGSRMAVHVEGPEQTRLLIVDLNSGAIVQSFLVTQPQE